MGGSTAVTRRRHKLKALAVEYKGGKCIICGYDRCVRALEFHHVNPAEKEFGLSSRGLTRSWIAIKHELDKTILLCANCHREVEAGANVPISTHRSSAEAAAIGPDLRYACQAETGKRHVIRRNSLSNFDH